MALMTSFHGSSPLDQVALEATAMPDVSPFGTGPVSRTTPVSVAVQSVAPKAEQLSSMVVPPWLALKPTTPATAVPDPEFTAFWKVQPLMFTR